MAYYDVYIKFDTSVKTSMFLYGTETPREVAQRLIEGKFLAQSDFDAGFDVVQFYPDAKTGAIILTDDSGFPYARFVKAEHNESGPQTFGEIEMQMEQQIVQKRNSEPICPTCGSHSIRRIGSAERGFAAGLFGFLSPTARSQFECQKCHYKW